MTSDDNQTPITVVSGMPRSGTSMMMKILLAGGMNLLIDDIRKPDDFNPRGYFEYEPVKSLQKGRTEWLPLAIGKVVKIITPLLPYLPDGYRYNVVFMTRSLDEILDSQIKMLQALRKTDTYTDDKMMRMVLENQIKKVVNWMDGQSHIRYITINYNELIDNPSNPLAKLTELLGKNLNMANMCKVIEPNLYRSKIDKAY